jgi:ABC-2 type transport system permease protein
MVPMALGLLILYNLWFALAALSIWFVKVHNVTYLLRSFMEAGRYPVTAYPLAYRLFFTFVLPVAFLTTVPAQAMLGRAAWYSWGLAALLALLLSVLARNAWRFSLRSYTSASS